MKVQSILDIGFEGVIIDVECTVTNGLPNVVIVGFANKAVDEAKERIRGAFASSNLPLPKKRITINLAPADLPKDTTSFDLAIASSILITSQIVPTPPVKTMIIGELGLDGSVRGVRGIIGKLLAAKRLGYSSFYLPAANANQASLVDGIAAYPIADLRQLYLHLTNTHPIKPLVHQRPKIFYDQTNIDFGEIVGQEQAKRAMQIAAAGGHNILLSGPPGTGKSMLAKALPGILPPMTNEEILEVTHLHSLHSKDFEKPLTARPVRSPHHSSSDIAIIGGGKNPRPGEISLSHRGVLFLDEFPEFSRSAIEALRQPLEDRIITVARAKDTLEFPANFMLVATANPCPCGNFGTKKSCDCLPHQIMRYQKKLSGPIMDRIDIHVNVEGVDHEKLLDGSPRNQNILLRTEVSKARQTQHARFNDPSKTNSMMTNQDIKNVARLKPESKDILDKAATSLDLSPRSYMRTIKVARTIADLEKSTDIEAAHIAEALQYRPKTDFQA